jgi:hypothetical protein
VSKLSPEARALLTAATAKEQPTAADEARVLAGIQQRLRQASGAVRISPDVPRRTPEAAGPVQHRRARVRWIIAGGVGLAAAALSIIGQRQHDTAVTRSTALPAHSATPPHLRVTPSAELRQAGAPESSVTDAPAPKKTRPRSERASADVDAAALTTKPSSFQQELALIRAAQGHLRAGAFTDALAQLREHQTQFSKGVLVEEREAALVLTLCGLGRVAEARQRAGALLSRSPNSPHAGTLSRSCAHPRR